MRAKKFTSEGIVISRKNYSEADRILVIYTNDYGKLFVMAKGVRKLKSKKRGHLEVFSHIKFSASKGSGIDVMTEVESINDFHKIKKDLKKVALAYYFMEVVFKLTSQEEKNKELFRLILNYLDIPLENKNLATFPSPIKLITERKIFVIVIAESIETKIPIPRVSANP